MIPIIFILCTFLPILISLQYGISKGFLAIMDSITDKTTLKNVPQGLILSLIISLPYLLLVIFEVLMASLAGTIPFYLFEFIGLGLTGGIIYLMYNLDSKIKNPSNLDMSQLSNPFTELGFGAQSVCSLSIPLVCPAGLSFLGSSKLDMASLLKNGVPLPKENPIPTENQLPI